MCCSRPWRSFTLVTSHHKCFHFYLTSILVFVSSFVTLPVLPCVDPVEYIANMSFALGFVSSDTILAIVIGLLGAFLLHVASKLLEVSVPFAVSIEVEEFETLSKHAI
jgi:hypothetical protein